MFGMIKKIMVVMLVGLVISSMVCGPVFAKETKIGYVDLRRAFYEYEKTKTMETELTSLTEESQTKRTGMIEEITKLRDAAEILQGDALGAKQAEIDQKLTQLQEYDRTTRQELLNKKNDMFRQVVDDIQQIVQAMGKTGGYDYILDSRNIMYSNESYDLTDTVVEQLNKQ